MLTTYDGVTDQSEDQNIWMTDLDLWSRLMLAISSNKVATISTASLSFRLCIERNTIHGAVACQTSTPPPKPTN